jgi:hypothetical protein
MSIKEGKKPLSSKPKQVNPFTSDILGNTLAIPDEIQAELESKGLVGRWLNAKEVYKNQGYHPRGWSVYRRDKPSSDTLNFKFGNDPDGIVRRGDCILGVKTVEQHKAHKDHLDARARRGYDINAEKAKEMKSLLGQSGLKNAKVLEGYDDNE